MRLKTTFLAGLMMLSLAGAGILAAQETQPPDAPPRPMMRGAMQKPGMGMRIPDLTDSQKEAIDKLRTDHMKKMLPVRNELMEKTARLRTLSTGDDVDMGKVDQVIEEIGKLKTRMMKEAFAHKQAVRKLLTPEQRVHFDSIGMGGHREGRPGMRHGMGKRPGRGQRGVPFDGPGEAPAPADN